MVGTGTKRSLGFRGPRREDPRSDLSHFVFRHSARDIETGGRSINLGSHFGFLFSGPLAIMKSKRSGIRSQPKSDEFFNKVVSH